MYSRILYIVAFSSFVADKQLHRTPMGTGRDNIVDLPAGELYIYNISIVFIYYIPKASEANDS